MRFTFKENIANLVLENVSVSALPKIALTALEDGIESESLLILAGMKENDNAFETEEFYKLALDELNILIPGKLDAGKTLLTFYLENIVSNSDKSYELMIKIDNEVYKKINWEEISTIEYTYLGEEMGLEKLYTWYREISDWNDQGKLLYHNDLPRNDQRIKFEKHLVNEAENLLNKIRQGTTHNNG